MFQPVSFFIGLRYSRSQNRSGFVSFITFFSIAGILLGVASLITVVSVMNGFEGELKKKILGLVPHIVVSAEQEKPANMPHWQQQREKLLAYSGVKAVTPLIESEALIQSPSTLQGVLLQGIIPEYETGHIINQHMVAGELSSLDGMPYSLVMGQALAHKLNVSVGDKIRLVIPNKTVFTPMGRVPVQRTFTLTGVFNVGSQIDDAVVYIQSRAAAKLLRRKGDGISQLRLYLNDAFYAGELTPQLKQDLSGYTFTTWNESQGALFAAVSMEKNMMWLMLSLIVAVAAFNIVSALVMVVIDKQGEIGILQTLGLARGEIVKIFITQGMVNGLWGVVLGSILGVLLTLNLNTLMSVTGINIFGPGYASQLLPIQLEAWNVAVIVFSALMMSFVATLYPAYRASKTQPAEVLRNE
ncbi:lipoprotein-releasing ABC transporter permease subunit [Thalassomonas viridans]|uniref:Lipoprotein-releasing ABC transporter permease subunit n=1 Tax=Thalassomonas viridans TaxID=137584 RepID=A0AAF0C7X6_9GAMM|nr:lipoprotein-releasing ABC transporter permease subunit [Thalassomonas viridans]WDE03811.1 lipoprotein-releasing ABC transporter permease subunit [Thalassomonas viridans]